MDARFHQALLKGSQNEMFFALKEPVRQALSYRIHQEWEGARGPGSGVGEPSASRPVRCRWRCGCIEAWPQPSNSASQKLPRRSRAILAEIGTDPLPLDDGIALEHALAPTVDPPPPGESTRVRSFSPVSPAPWLSPEGA